MIVNNLFYALLAILSALQAQAQYQAKAPISSRDRIYTGDQTSNTITVIEPSKDEVLGTIAIGNERLLNDFNPQYEDQVNSHGLGFSRDGKYVVSLSTTSNTATIIRTADNKVVNTWYVDRGAHEAFFAADNRTVWVGTRGVSSVNIIDAFDDGHIDRIFTGAGPSKVLFSPDGNTAYVNHIFAPVLTVIDVPSRKVKYNITGLAASFSSDQMINWDRTTIWAAHKMAGKASVIDLAARKVIAILNTGPETNHPNFVVVNRAQYGYITSAAQNIHKDASTPPVHVKDVRMQGIEPHGIWPDPFGSDNVDVIDTSTTDIIDSFGVEQEGQSLIYVSQAMEEGNDGKENLGTQGLNLCVENRLIPVQQANCSDKNRNEKRQETQEQLMTPQALIIVRETRGLDMFQVIGRKFVLNGTYTVSAMCKGCHEDRTPLVTFNASTPTPMGCGRALQVLAFFEFFDADDLGTVELHEIVGNATRS